MALTLQQKYDNAMAALNCLKGLLGAHDWASAQELAQGGREVLDFLAVVGMDFADLQETIKLCHQLDSLIQEVENTEYDTVPQSLQAVIRLVDNSRPSAMPVCTKYHDELAMHESIEGPVCGAYDGGKCRGNCPCKHRVG